MDKGEKLVWDIFNAWFDSKKGNEAIEKQGGNLNYTNPLANVCTYSFAGEAFIAGFLHREEIIKKLKSNPELKALFEKHIKDLGY